jgi:nucleoid-associated protein EbfC
MKVKNGAEYHIDVSSHGEVAVKGNLGNLMKQAQKLQEDMLKAQQEMATLEVMGQAGGGMVEVLLNGKHEARRVKIDPKLFADDKDMLEDLVAAAINDAAHKLEQAMKDKFSGMGAGLNLPAGIKLPF